MTACHFIFKGANKGNLHVNNAWISLSAAPVLSAEVLR